MTRYAIMAAALLVGVLIGVVISRLTNARRAKNPDEETIYVDQRQPYWYVPWLGGISVLVIGLFLLADPTRAPKDSTYAPAVIKDGQIQPGQFSPKSGPDQADD